MTERLILNDETVIEDGSAGFAGGLLWLSVPLTMQDAARVFFDPEKTAEIEYQYGEMNETFTGFTECITLQLTDRNTVNVCMRKGAG